MTSPTGTTKGNGAPHGPFAEAEELAGFFVAHALWAVSGGGSMRPMLGYAKGGERAVLMIEDADIARAVLRGQKWLKKNPERAERAVLVYDCFVHLPSGRIDGLMAEVIAFAKPPMSLQVVVPYRSAKSGRFAVHRPKFQAFKGIPDLAALGPAFIRGVRSHEHGGAIWQQHWDDSI